MGHVLSVVFAIVSDVSTKVRLGSYPSWTHTYIQELIQIRRIKKIEPRIHGRHHIVLQEVIVIPVLRQLKLKLRVKLLYSKDGITLWVVRVSQLDLVDHIGNGKVDLVQKVGDLMCFLAIDVPRTVALVDFNVEVMAISSITVLTLKFPDIFQCSKVRTDLRTNSAFNLFFEAVIGERIEVLLFAINPRDQMVRKETVLLVSQSEIYFNIVLKFLGVKIH